MNKQQSSHPQDLLISALLSAINSTPQSCAWTLLLQRLCLVYHTVERCGRCGHLIFEDLLGGLLHGVRQYGQDPLALARLVLLLLCKLLEMVLMRQRLYLNLLLKTVYDFR